MDELTADECRVLGVLVEKAFTTPDQYPLTLNAVVNGCNQKNNRDPDHLDWTTPAAFDALESLRAKKLVIRADMAGSRVNKYKHTANDVLHVRAGELAVLAELLLRGPQTLGEIRGPCIENEPCSIRLRQPRTCSKLSCSASSHWPSRFRQHPEAGPNAISSCSAWIRIGTMKTAAPTTDKLPNRWKPDPAFRNVRVATARRPKWRRSVAAAGASLLPLLVSRIHSRLLPLQAESQPRYSDGDVFDRQAAASARPSAFLESPMRDVQG